MTARRATVVLIAALAVWASYAFVALPLWCHHMKIRLKASSQRAYRMRGPAGRMQARANIERLERCLAPGCRDIRLYLLLAFNYRTVGRSEVALDLYDHALRHGRRADIYGSIGDTYLVLGNRRQAFEAYLQSALFSPVFLGFIGEPEMRAAVAAEVVRRHPELAGAVQTAMTTRSRRELRK